MRPDIRDGDLFLAADAAKRLGVSREMVVKLCNQGRLPCVRTARGVRLLWRADVEAERRRRIRAGKLAP